MEGLYNKFICLISIPKGKTKWFDTYNVVYCKLQIFKENYITVNCYEINFIK
jgi:hypothetical protein